MSIIAALLGCYIVVILLGQRVRRIRTPMFLYVALFALLQTGFVLLMMFTIHILTAE